MSSQATWDEYFMGIAHAVSLKSEDGSNKIGAVIVGCSNEILATGYNGFPRGIRHDQDKQVRPLKYTYFEHAERNAIYNAARAGTKTNNSTMYCLWPPCTSCARAVIQAGVVRVVVGRSIAECPDRWHDDLILAVDMLREGGVTFELLTNNSYGPLSLMFLKK